jgi:menaquinone-dependent protoporphyrinogen oxidase
MSNVLVAYATKHGATEEIAEAITGELLAAGHAADRVPAEDVKAVDSYDAVLIGSAVYMGRWHRATRQLLSRQSKELGERPLWLFSSGPCGQADPSWSAPPGIERQAKRLGARGHVVFGGRMPSEPSNFIERGIAQKASEEYRDLRDWDTIRGWAREIATELSPANEPMVGAAR